ncbi:hypothetical protein EMCRGX_G022531 [Ephydatia muelleri]|eukprot:Em0009g1265a
MEDSEYIRIVEETKQMVMQYAQEDWPLLKQSNGVEVTSTQSPGSPVRIYKAVGELNASPPVVFDYAAPPGFGTIREKWDKTVKRWEVLKTVTENVKVLRSESFSALMGLISPRDFVDVVMAERSDDISFTCGRGVDYPHPEDPAYVRGMNYPSAMLCFAAKGKPATTRMVLMVQTDPRGSIPHKLIETAVPSVQLQFFTQLRKALKDGEAHRERGSRTHS